MVSFAVGSKIQCGVTMCIMLHGSNLHRRVHKLVADWKCVCCVLCADAATPDPQR